ncbi:MAG: 2-C-methyl-D-erythritol 4-phosphate cytidylyltransferase [Methanobrevibacter sp.]|nr:2-C-methyl-D-erythritol 4-phosphate cytidylyltransferase [Methanobrevibacter sp.]MBQ2654699.1 2-C-methyl-D-erythritol 4-phosphate cytidylyltransferase [Methanobrevibacter sp.]
MIFAAILAGGTGTRLGMGVPKQFFKINNKPLLAYCIEPFLKVDLLDKIIISSPKQYLNDTQELIDKYFDDNRLIVIEGGKTRNDTILNSIYYAIENGADDNAIMVTHDGARIFVSPKLIEDSIKYACEFGAASPVVPAVDVIFQSKENNKLTKIPERKHLFHAQTPQSFNIKKFIEIYEDLTEDEINLLDEAMMLFYLRDEEVYLFEGDSSNFKITRPFDITISESILGD